MKKNKYKFNRLLIGLTTALLLATTGVHAGQTARVSVSSTGTQRYDDSRGGGISADGRYVLFSSSAMNGWKDVFLHDRVNGTTTRVSVNSAGTQGNCDSYGGLISADGRYVVFTSCASNLANGDADGWEHVFVRDLMTRKTERISVNSAEEQGNYDSGGGSISADGRYVAFTSRANNLVKQDTNGLEDVFVRDRVTGTTTRVSVSWKGLQGMGFPGSRNPVISADGRYVTFTSGAENLVAKDTNYWDDIFVRDRVAGTTARVSISSKGAQGNYDSGYYTISPISADGRYVAFTSGAYNLVDGDTNANADVFVRDRVAGTTTRVNLSSAEEQEICPWPSDPELCDTDISGISADGRYVAFYTPAENLVAGDTNRNYDGFVRDRLTGITTRVTVSSSGAQGKNGYSFINGISADGRQVAFTSVADNLVTGDTNNASDVFVRDRLLNTTYIADLQATVTAKPASVKKGQTASYTLTVKNNGPDSASNVALTDIVSNGTVLSITPSQGTCSKAAISVCRLGTLAAGASATVAVTIRAEACSLTQQLSVSATPKDNSPSNNAVRISTPVIIP